MRNILLPTDFSSNARNAAAYALQFFKDVPCTFHLLHVIPVPGDKFATKYLTTSPEVQKKFDELLLWLNSIKTNQDHKFSIAFTANYLIEAVRSQVLEKNIDLILMGTKGATNKEGTIIGKHTSDVMMKVKCPVLAISENAIFKGANEILFPTDYKIPYGANMLRTLFKVISMSNASMKVLEIYNNKGEPTEDQLTNKKFLQTFFEPNVPALQTYYPRSNSNSESLFAANNPDMIVMAAKNLNICHKLLRNHQSEHIPFINQLPLLVLH